MRMASDWDIQRRPDEEIPRYKRNQMEAIKALVKDNNVLGLVRITGIPGAQFQQMRKNLDENVHMMVVRNNLLYLALKEVMGDVKALDDFLDQVEGQTALIATNLNPFRLYKQLEGTKTKSPAKGGETAPEDIVVEEGETDFKAGPIVGDLQKVGIPAGIVRGKVVIKSTKTLVKEGDKISQGLAAMLTRLNIFPLTVGLDLRAALEEGMVYLKEVLAVDDSLITAQMQSAATGAYNLAMFMSFPTKITIEPLIAKAHGEVMALAMFAHITNKESVGPLLAKACAEAGALKALVDRKSDTRARDALTGEVLEGDKPAKPDKPPKEEKEEKEVTEEDAAAGLGNLFGD
jgi:large subunit ribosomal protein L10